MVVTATFTGENNSHGYKTGQKYELELNIINEYGALSVDCKTHLICRYDSFFTFLRNWNFLTVKR